MTTFQVSINLRGMSAPFDDEKVVVLPVRLASGLIARGLCSVYSPPALPEEPATPEAVVERPPLPPRRISETLLSFVQPLIPGPVEGDPDLVVTLLELGVTAWNAVVLDTWEPGQERVGAVRAAVRALPRAQREGLLPLFEELVERKRRDFQEDCRLMSGLRVCWSPEGEPFVRLEARLPGSLRAAR